MEFLYAIVVFGVIFAIVLIRTSITRKANEARAVRERAAAAQFLAHTDVTPSAAPPIQADAPPPPPPPGW